MDWQKERDALINETMALVARVNVAKPKLAIEALAAKPLEPIISDRQAARRIADRAHPMGIVGTRAYLQAGGELQGSPRTRTTRTRGIFLPHYAART